MLLKLKKFFKLNTTPPNLQKDAFDFLRLLFACVIVFSHSFILSNLYDEPKVLAGVSYVTLGTFCVYGFFIMSGYLITKSAFNSTSTINFIQKRFLKIYPSYLVSLIIITFIFGPLIFWFRTSLGFLEYLKNYGLDSLHYIANNFFLEQKQVYIGSLVDNLPQSKAGYNGPYWTLMYEAWCYIILAILIWLGWAKKKLPIILLFVIYYLIYILGYSNLRFRYFIEPQVPFVTFVVFSYFFAGSLFFHFKDKIIYDYKLAILALVIVAIGFYFSLLPIVLPIFGSYLVFFLAFRLPFYSFGKLGDFSYGIYIYTYVVQRLIYSANQDLDLASFTLISLLGGFVCAFLNWHLVEKKFLVKKVKPVELEINS